MKSYVSICKQAIILSLILAPQPALALFGQGTDQSNVGTDWSNTDKNISTTGDITGDDITATGKITPSSEGIHYNPGGTAVDTTIETKLTQVVNVSDWGTFITALTDIGSTPTTLNCNSDIVIPDGVTATLPSTLNLNLQPGCDIDGVAGGGTETLTVNGAITGDLSTRFIGSNLTVNGKPKVDWVSPLWWTTNTTPGTTDMTTAFQAAIDLATTADHIPVYIPVGKYLITDIINRHEGVPVIGQSPGATSETYGVQIFHASNSTLFLCDGNGRSAAGVGGVFKNLTIIKQAGYAGGDAIKYLATDDAHRPGEEYIENVLIYGTGGGLWDRALHIDGTACVTPGSKGVREVVLNKFRFADCQVDNEHMLINQGTAVTGTHVQMDVGGSPGTPGITIKGESTYIQLTNAIINGDVLIDSASTSDNVNINGHIGSLTQNQVGLDGGFTGTISGATINKSYDFKLNIDKMPKFQAVLTASVANVTGDDTDYTILFNNEIYDTTSGYNPATGIFTAAVAGLYKFHSQVVLAEIDVAHTRTDPYLLFKTAAGAERIRTSKISSPSSGVVFGYYSYDLSGQFLMDYGDTVQVVADVKNGTKVVDIYGSTGQESTFFEGALQ